MTTNRCYTLDYIQREAHVYTRPLRVSMSATV